MKVWDGSRRLVADSPRPRDVYERDTSSHRVDLALARGEGVCGDIVTADFNKEQKTEGIRIPKGREPLQTRDPVAWRAYLDRTRDVRLEKQRRYYAEHQAAGRRDRKHLLTAVAGQE